jgi:hypothetical protein
LPAPLVSATVKTAVLVAAGRLATVTTPAAVLTRGVLNSMFLAKLKLTVGVVMVAAALGATGLAYRATAQVAEQRRVDAKPRSELEALRHENELLKLNLEVVLEKVRAQEAELRTFRAMIRSRRILGDRVDLNAQKEGDEKRVREVREKLSREDLLKLETRKIQDEIEAQTKRLLEEAEKVDRAARQPDPVPEAEAALKALRSARDKESKRRAADALEKALKKLREQLQLNERNTRQH